MERHKRRTRRSSSSRLLICMPVAVGQVRWPENLAAPRPQCTRWLLIPEQRRYIETFASLIAMALERVHFVQVAQSMLVSVESERLRAHVRRAAKPDASASAQYAFSDIVVDMGARSVRRAGKSVHLTPIEYRLLTTLITNAGRVVTQRQLLLQVWGPGYVERRHYLRIHMGHLRHKLEKDPAQPQHF